MKDLRIRKLLSLFLCLAMCLSMVPAAWANEPDYEDTDYEDTGYEDTGYFQRIWRSRFIYPLCYSEYQNTGDVGTAIG